MNIELVKANETDAEKIWNMQKVAFAELLERYQDFETNPASEPLEKTVTDKGYCVLQPVYNFYGSVLSETELQNIKKAHYKKIDISDAIFVVNVGGYIGKSVAEEIEYAKSLNKEIIYLE